MFEQDYIMRLVKEIARMLAKILFKKDISTVIEEKQNDLKSGDGDDIFSLADKGEINKAENILSDIIDDEPEEGIELGVAFYSYINEFDNEFLESNNYSREEIKQGLESIMAKAGISGLGVAFDMVR